MYKVVLFFLVASVKSAPAAKINATAVLNGDLGLVVPRGFKFIATANNKVFLADLTEGTWNEAMDYCKSNGYKLASIEDKTEFDALDDAYSTADFSGWHWVSARDAQTIDQFIWNESGNSLDSTYLVFLPSAWSPPICTCVAFNSIRGASHLSALACSSPRVYPMCETAIP